MRYAITDISNQTEVQYSGQKGICPVCNSDVKGRKAGKNTEHWYHLSLKNCDSWYEPITQWHLDWQNLFPIYNREFVLVDKTNNTIHRADIRLDDGFVIEIQNSFIKDDEVLQRENFYGKFGMCWILNGATLAKSCSLKYNFTARDISLKIDLPYSTNHSKDYDMDELVSTFLKSDLFLETISDPNFAYYDKLNGNYISIHFNKNFDTDQFKNQVRQTLKSILTTQLNSYLAFCILDEIEIVATNIGNNIFENVKLEKKYWRVFIDKMKMPVYIDNLKGLSNDYIYNYSKNRIISKKEFLDRYRINQQPT